MLRHEEILMLRACLACVLAAAALAGEPGADPAWYARKASWPDTMLASREALAKAQAEAPKEAAFKPYVTGIVRGGQPAQQISLDVSTLDQLWLVADVGDDNYDWDQAIWAEPRLVTRDGAEVRLPTLQPVSVKVGWGQLILNNSHTGGGLRIANKKYEYGFWAHAPSALCFALGRKYARFEAWVGIGAEATSHGSVRFHVLDRADRTSDLETLWALVRRDFPAAAREMAWERDDRIWDDDWRPGDLATLAARYAKCAASRASSVGAEAQKLAPGVAEAPALQKVRELYYRARTIEENLAKLGDLKFEPLRLAIADLIETQGDKYPKGREFLQRLDALEKSAAAEDKAASAEHKARLVEEFESLKREALLANPLLSFDKLLVVRRHARNLALPANWQGNSCLPRSGLDNEIAVLSLRAVGGASAPRVQTLYKPEGGKFVGDVDLHFDADRILFSSLDARNRWQVFEMTLQPPAGSQPAGASPVRQLTGEQPDVDSYDACYLPDGRIIFGSTAAFVGVPCVFGSSHVSMLYRMDADGRNIRQLCFEQDHDWCPTVLNNGRVLYLRWEYTDTPHSQTRLLFHMNPDGTEQMEYYGSNSYWPNGIFYARPIPNHPTKVVGIVTGHHGVPRMGELVVFDPGKGRHEASGAIQRIPGYGKPVERVVRDALVDGSWPKFLHPYPLSEKHFLVSCKPTPQAHWGLYLVDTFDNMLLLHEEPDYAILEPVPLRKTPRPPVIPDKADPKRKDAVVYMVDVYQGDGLKGVPRGSVKRLRIFSYHFAYHGMGGLLGVVGMDGPWDPKRIVGTVPVEADGSALFRVPANTPLSIQPLDAEGKALQLMRSWMTAMPGETLSCVGCHEKQNSSPPAKQTIAQSKPPAEIEPWRGPARAFSYAREVQPVVDKYCIACHEGTKAVTLRGDQKPTDFSLVTPGNGGGNAGRFSLGYIELSRYVRRNGIEGDYHLLTPLEFHADTTELVQLLRKGHYGVRLDAEAWDRLVTWIDLNTPYFGTWTEMGHNPGKQRERRLELARLYANLDDDPEADAALPPAKLGDPAPPPVSEIANRKSQIANPPGWPFDAAEAKRKQAAAGPATARTIELGPGITMELVLIPAGEFLMGDNPVGGVSPRRESRDGDVPPTMSSPDEQPVHRVRIERPFWMGRCEVSNEQFALFDSAHDSRVEDKNTYQFGVHGYPCNEPKQPVVRLSWHQAMAFCEWLSRKTGERFTLPTEAQWEWACRAGTATPFWYGGLDADFSKYANMADAKMREFASNPYTVWEPQANATKYDDWIPKDTRFNDGHLVAAPIGSYQPNPWGLCDMHGNMAEWTRSEYRPYPSDESDQSDRSDKPAARRVVRGGSWRDRPYRCTSAYRLAYPAFQRPYNVTFRVICETATRTASKPE
ncbi:MAG TPA: SUMF1/EgtB/PvdO family nonheme iron enzyme [Planctomycetota bacterium]|nr:SUMF1/EgtB/PvdO family nonheme iron enzyme [Planctomycetota bacterium]HRR79921.1 SUMF1/EgtB/PvdO family nonheme iron enzyme [Planctomycetota bacterium]HRT94574.1 SUMF1/EgtB/PvdO family nonheme iron enzyme [Planctomycetota bacterium]